ncbi:MAG: L-aspartate oxidase, partial [Planctomycetota bacterium]
NSIRSLMWHNIGILRNQELLQKALNTLDQWANYILPIEFQDSRGWELQNMLITARLMTYSALKREESRGVHFRDDFPKRNPAQDYHHTEILRSAEEEPKIQYTRW